jgi:hypothetical protein
MIWLLSPATLRWVGRSLNYPRKSAGPEEIRMATALAKINYSRRMVSRVETGDDVWVYWSCCGMDDVSRVCDLSVGGLFLSTPSPRPVGEKVKLDFLVREGQIRVEAVVQHLIPNGGVGLKFTAVTDRDCPNLVALMNRMRTLACSPRRVRLFS